MQVESLLALPRLDLRAPSKLQFCFVVGQPRIADVMVMLPKALLGFSCSGPTLASCTWQSLAKCTSLSMLQCKLKLAPVIPPKLLLLDLVQLEANCVDPENSAVVEWCVSVARNSTVAKLMLIDCAPLLLPKFHGLQLDSLCLWVGNTSAVHLQQVLHNLTIRHVSIFHMKNGHLKLPASVITVELICTAGDLTVDASESPELTLLKVTVNLRQTLTLTEPHSLQFVSASMATAIGPMGQPLETQLYVFKQAVGVKRLRT